MKNQMCSVYYYHLQEGFATFYRNHQDNFNHYTSEQKVFVNSVISRAAVAVRTSSSHSDISSRLMDYIWH